MEKNTDRHEENCDAAEMPKIDLNDGGRNETRPLRRSMK